ncbi:homing endonuclease associated repeat-containing protein [Halobacterium wangiae]|uniref:homing endonuclease associated repeat-containing protein n=1 Tax=Halobacterium wangiae TaxID=2902623 RepID=UPI001E4842C2|nr:hypothetical protein [Halobacterium wangiae]
MASLSEDDLLEEIDRLAAEYGRPPTLQELRDHGEYGASTYYTYFGSWQDALEAAGYEPRPPQTAATKQELLEELQRLANEIGHPPSVSEMNVEGVYWASTYKNHFDSWANALEAAGLDSTRADLPIGRPRLRAALIELGETLEKRPTFREMEDQGKYDPTTYIREYGSWKEALEAAGFEPPTDLTEDTLLRDLVELAGELGKQPSQRDMNNHGSHSHTTYVRHFGSWSNAIEAAFDTD